MNEKKKTKKSFFPRFWGKKMKFHRKRGGKAGKPRKRASR